MTIRSKILTAIILPTTLSILLISILGYTQVRDSLTEQVLSNLKTETHLVSQDIHTFMEQFSSDLLALSHVPPIEGIVRAMDNKGIDPEFNISVEVWKTRFAQNLISQAENKKFYLEIDYLDERGQELVRVNYRNGKSSIVPPSELHDESQNKYYLATTALKKGEIFVSKLHLKRNEGVLEKPYLPLIRFGTPVFDKEGNLHGALILKIYAQSFLQRLDAVSGKIFIVNSDGYYLYNSDSSKVFGFEFDKEITIFKDYPELPTDHQGHSQAFLNSDTGQIFSLGEVPFDPVHPDRYWIVVRVFSEESALQGENQLLNMLLTGIALVILVLAGIAFLVSGTISTPIISLTGVARKISEGDTEVTAKIESQDELGKLAQTFNHMLDAQRHSTDEMRKLMFAIEQSPNPVVITDLEGKIEYVNPAFTSTSGYSESEALGRTSNLLNSGYHPQQLFEGLWKNILSGKKWSGELRNQRKDGSFYWVSANIAPITNENNKMTHFVAVNENITARRALEKEQQKTMAKLDMQKYALDQAAIVSIVDLSGEIVYVNEMFIKISKYSSQELIGHHHRVVNSGYHPKSFMKEVWNTITAGEVWNGNINNQAKDGNVYWLSTTIVPFLDEDKKPLEYLGIQFDITEQKQAEEENKKQREELDRSLKILEAADVQQTGHAELNKIMIGESNLMTISRKVILYLAKFTESQVGAIYLANEEGTEVSLSGSYAFTQRKHLNTHIKLGEGLVGQAALEQEMIVLQSVPEDYIRISSALGSSAPQSIVVVPFLYGGKLVGVVELGALQNFSKTCLDFLNSSMESIAVGINAAAARAEMQKLLQLRQEQAKELQVQQEELRLANGELTKQADVLKQSEERLKLQKEELHSTNEELADKTRSLEEQKTNIVKKNIDLEVARKDIERKANELEISSKYKSEFLANMSHELRTPLNSLLILSQHLSQNTEGNLNEDEVESATIVYNSGNDLLTLINDILDLSKIEAGQMNIEVEEISLQEVLDTLQATFQHVADQRKVELKFNMNSDAPKIVYTDRLRIGQILKNLISNALKFTHEGSVTLSVHLAKKDLKLQSQLDPSKVFSLAVTDTGIGIPEDKQQAIFQAFQQAEGGTTRKYGGTGLGLSISRELSRLLGGEIQIQSEVGKGSTFTLHLPLGSPDDMSSDGQTSRVYSSRIDPAPRIAPVPIAESTAPSEERPQENDSIALLPPQQNIPDDRDSLKEGERIVLVIEDDPAFSKILNKQCHAQGFRCLNALSGEDGLSLAKEFSPHAIILDINLPGISGWNVLESLKESSETRHIPVHMMSGNDVDLEALKKGAIGFLSKPVSQTQLDNAFKKFEDILGCKMKRLLLVDDTSASRAAIIKLIGDTDVEATEVATGSDALKHLKSEKFHCMILDLGLPDISGFEVLNQAKADSSIELPPVIVHTAKSLTKEEEETLHQYTDSIVIKGVKSPERLLDETSLFLHRMLQELPDSQRSMISSLHDKDHIFKEKKVLLVDDDMRNLYSLSKILQGKGIKVAKAKDGQKALDFLESDSDIDLVLMDIMMPVLDGLETIEQIRAQSKFETLPIIALTAKAMKEDRQKCMESGASDYLPKPIDVDRLFSMMRVWLYQ